MFEGVWSNVASLMHQGGWVMWPLLVLSVISLTLIFERAWFWTYTNNPWRRAKLQRIGQSLRRGDADTARRIAASDASAYGRLAGALLDDQPSDAAVAEAIESQRSQLERFMPTLGTIITAAPMLGILGTVTGIIRSFRVLSPDQAITDPSQVAGGIAEALLTTVVGLIVALVVLFPYNVFKAQIDRTLGRMEALIASARGQQADGRNTPDHP